MADCYNVIFNNSTSAFEIHTGGDPLVDDTGLILHDCGFSVETSSTINALLLTSAGVSVTSANIDTNTVISNAHTSASAPPIINTTINQEVVDMKVNLIIVAISPVIKTEYNKSDPLLPSGVVRKD